MTRQHDPTSRRGLTATFAAATIVGAMGMGLVVTSGPGSAQTPAPGSSTASATTTSGPSRSPEPRPSTIASPAVTATPRSLVYDGDATGASDVTADLQAFIDAAPDGSTILFDPDGRYRLDCTIWVSQRSSLTFDGRGATFAAPDTSCPSEAIWRFHGGGAHTIRDMTIEGSHGQPGTYVPALEFQAGIEVLGTAGLEISSVTLRRTYGDCVYVGYNNRRGGAWESSSDVWIHDVDCSGSGRQGIAVTSATDVLIEDSVFSEQGYIVLDIEPDRPPNSVKGVTFRDNVIFGRVASQMVSIGGTGDVSDVVIERNRVLDGPNHGIWTVIEPLGGHRRSNIVIRGNVAETTFAAGRRLAVFIVRSTDGATISGNIQPREFTHLLLAEITDSCGILLAENDPGGLVIGDAHEQPCG